LCVLLGAAGKPNHVTGLKAAGTVVAVNIDEQSAVFEAADYGIVGDWAEVARALAARLRNRTAGI
jgi:electron transfer flavoprotein alpha subunit